MEYYLLFFYCSCWWWHCRCSCAALRRRTAGGHDVGLREHAGGALQHARRGLARHLAGDFVDAVQFQQTSGVELRWEIKRLGRPEWDGAKDEFAAKDA